MTFEDYKNTHETMPYVPIIEIEHLTCKCGNDTFHVGTNGKIARCGHCGTLYDEDGKEIEMKYTIRNNGSFVDVKIRTEPEW